MGRDSKIRAWLLKALCVALLSVPVALSGQISMSELRRTQEDADLAIAVYDLSKTEIAGGWKQIARQSDPDGFKAAVYERVTVGGKKDVRIVYAGTELNDPHDIGFDARLVAPGGRSVYDEIDQQAYLARAQAFAAGYVHAAKNDGSSVRVVGHSLGGTLAQYVSAKLDVAATALNSAALSRKIEATLSTAEQERADRNVIQFFERLDYVQRPTRWAGGTQHGRQYMLESASWASKDPHSVEHIRASINAAISDVDQNPNSERFISLRVPVSQEKVELLMRNLTLLGEGLGALKKNLDLRNNFRPGGPNVPESITKGLGKISAAIEQINAWKTVIDLASAVREDQAQFRDKPFVPLQSKTLEFLGEAALTGHSLPGVKNPPLGEGLLRKLYTVLDDQKLIPPQPRVSLLRETVEVGAPSFGGIDLLKAGLGYQRKGHLGIDDIDALADACVGLVWGVVGFVRSGFNLRAAEMHQEVAQTIAQNGRLFMRETGTDKVLLRRIDSDFRKQPTEILEMYRTIQERRAFDGQRIQTFDEFLEGDLDGSRGPRNPGTAAQMKLAFSAPDFDRQVLRAESDAGAFRFSPPNTINAGGNSDDLRSAVKESELAARLARAENRVLLIGNGPGADKAYDELVRRCGIDNVKRVPAVTGNYEKNALASEFGAKSVIKISVESYREITRGGYRQIEPKLQTPRLARNDELGPPDNPGKYLPPDFRRRGPPGAAIGDEPLAKAPAATALQPNVPRWANSFSAPRVGGVMLQGVAEVENSDSQRAEGNFSLIFQGSDGGVDVATLRRFVTALWATYFTTNGPGISIDPVGDYTNRHAVRYIGRVINSDLGRVMRETDYMMKSWAVGTSRPDLDNWLTPEEIGIRNSKVHGGRSRFWFIPEHMKFRKAGDALLFEDGMMTIKTEYLLERKGEQNPENEEWARQFTRRYAEVAGRYPVFHELFEYAKLVSLAKYLKEKSVPLLWFLLANREMALTEDSPGTVKAFAKKSDYFEEAGIAGGVDLSPGVQPNAFVVDAEFLKALTEAKKTASRRDTKSDTPEPSPIEVVEYNSESLTFTPSQTVVISDSKSGRDSFATDLGLRLNRGPHLELARYRRSHFPQVHTFGRDWHLMIPYAIKAASNRGVPSPLGVLPEKIVLRNLLTGFEETLNYRDELRTGTNTTPIIGFYPDAPEFNLNIGVFPLTDKTFRLTDKLGCEYDFDAAGRLTRMLLAEHLDYRTNSSGRITNSVRVKDYEVAYQYAQKRLNWRDYDVLPFRLAPEGKDGITVETEQFPKQVRLFDAATGSEELFVFGENQANAPVGYVPAERNRSGYTFLRFNPDRSLMLEHKSGCKINFDRSGQFRSLIVDVLERIIQEPYEVQFDYEITRGQYRITTARVVDRKSSEPLHAVVYKYGRDGSLTGSSLVSSK